MSDHRQVRFPLTRGPGYGNTQAATHGLSMPGDKLPAGCEDIRVYLVALQEQLEEEIALRHAGEVSVFNAAVIQSAVRHEKRCQLVERWLRLEGDGLSVGERAGLLKDLSAATTARDKCLEQLNLHQAFKANTWSVLNGKSADGDDQPKGVPREPAD